MCMLYVFAKPNDDFETIAYTFTKNDVLDYAGRLVGGLTRLSPPTARHLSAVRIQDAAA